MTHSGESRGGVEPVPMPAPVAGEVNAHIRETTKRFSRAMGHDDSVASFFCQCGCGSHVALSGAQFDAAGGAWIEGHGPRGA